MESTPPILFNRRRLRKRRARASAHFAQHDFLWHEAAARAEDTLSVINRKFSRVAMIGGHGLTPPKGAQFILHADQQLLCDEEYWPFAENSLDAVICLLNLQWVNDLPGTLLQIQRSLKPDGLFYATLPGSQTLQELRQVFTEIEVQQTGGMTPRVAPFIDVRDAGALLQRAGFALPVADSEILTIHYEHLFSLMNDLRGSGQANMLQNQVQHFTPRRFFMAAAEHYAKTFPGEDGGIRATVEFVTLTGWKPAANQQQPAKRGSGQVSLAKVFN